MVSGKIWLFLKRGRYFYFWTPNVFLPFLGQLADGASTVFVGYFSDAKDDLWLCNTIGNRRSWHLIGSMCVLISFPFIFVPCITCSMSHQSAQMVSAKTFQRGVHKMHRSTFESQLGLLCCIRDHFSIWMGFNSNISSCCNS